MQWAFLRAMEASHIQLFSHRVININSLAWAASLTLEEMTAYLNCMLGLLQILTLPDNTTISGYSSSMPPSGLILSISSWNTCSTATGTKSTDVPWPTCLELGPRVSASTSLLIQRLFHLVVRTRRASRHLTMRQQLTSLGLRLVLNQRGTLQI